MATRHSSSKDSDPEAFLTTELFQEPANFRPPSPEPTIIDHLTPSGKSLKIRLVGGHPLWGHVLYPASVLLARYIENNSASLFPENQSIKVLELGAGGGLPGLTCVLSGAALVVSTDFPDPDLIHNLEWNANTNLTDSLRSRLIVQGLKWGAKVDHLFSRISPISSNDVPNNKATNSSSPKSGFDLILLSDLVFNHSEHKSLLATCEECLKPRDPDQDGFTPCLLVFYSHHRPRFAKADDEFIDIARQRGWMCEKILEDKNAGLAFPEDDGDPIIRGTVHGWSFTR
ncbi:hypothetical protein O181_049040 [Austropuccinia psidii MF-1]|uniref:Protein N-terminal and lysine N-methyltransferase EFM7 n=1 Tax=Austropuccinia psidii MF-1 TaxID=1389203 RepID=A0A9Q3DSX2_9BASI|nr:hypothetical protein [Austropuccinia psidii MF-1]